MFKDKTVLKLSLSNHVRAVHLFLFIISSLYLLANFISVIVFLVNKVSIFDIYFLPYKQDVMLSDYYFILGLHSLLSHILLLVISFYFLLESALAVFKCEIEIKEDYILIFLPPFLIRKKILFKHIIHIDLLNSSDISFIERLKCLTFGDSLILKISVDSKEYFLPVKDRSAMDILKSKGYN